MKRHVNLAGLLFPCGKEGVGAMFQRTHPRTLMTFGQLFKSPFSNHVWNPEVPLTRASLAVLGSWLMDEVLGIRCQT